MHRLINVGHIRYANCTPIFSALKSHFDCSGYQFVNGVPARLNALLRQGEIDLSPSSSFEYASAHEEYLLLPELSISAIGAVKSVLLFSRLPIEQLDGARIGLTAESDTSVNLLKVLLAQQYGFSTTFERTPLGIGDAFPRYQALLLIGDAALKAVAAPNGCQVYDLGELWQNFTGLPFVFALWIVRRDAALKKGKALATLAAELVRAKEIAYASYEEIAGSCEERQWMEPAELAEYWRTISYDLTPAHVEGARRFFGYAHRMGLIPTLPELEFFAG